VLLAPTTFVFPDVSIDRRAVGGAGHVLVSSSLESDGALAAFTERSVGHSADPYRSLNMSLAVGDDADRVRRNRLAVIESLDLPAFATAEQVHGSRLVRVGTKRRAAGFDDPTGRVAGADALATSSAGVPLAMLTADCVPVVLHSASQGVIAVVHAGWRGIAGGIVAGAASTFADPRGVRAAIGPAIGPCHYEVGEDVALAVAAGTDMGAVTDRRGGRVFLDLVGTVRAELRALGIRDVEDTGLCTACESDRFFSFRRDGLTGRQAAVASLLS
jgi:YfiH family protein